jgi:hypothetical protein
VVLGEKCEDGGSKMLIFVNFFVKWECFGKILVKLNGRRLKFLVVAIVVLVEVCVEKFLELVFWIGS